MFLSCLIACLLLVGVKSLRISVENGIPVEVYSTRHISGYLYNGVECTSNDLDMTCTGYAGTVKAEFWFNPDIVADVDITADSVVLHSCDFGEVGAFKTDHFRLELDAEVCRLRFLAVWPRSGEADVVISGVAIESVLVQNSKVNIGTLRATTAMMVACTDVSLVNTDFGDLYIDSSMDVALDMSSVIGSIPRRIFVAAKGNVKLTVPRTEIIGGPLRFTLGYASISNLLPDLTLTSTPSRDFGVIVPTLLAPTESVLIDVETEGKLTLVSPTGTCVQSTHMMLLEDASRDEGVKLTGGDVIVVTRSESQHYGLMLGSLLLSPDEDRDKTIIHTIACPVGISALPDDINCNPARGDDKNTFGCTSDTASVHPTEYVSRTVMVIPDNDPDKSVRNLEIVATHDVTLAMGISYLQEVKISSEANTRIIGGGATELVIESDGLLTTHRTRVHEGEYDVGAIVLLYEEHGFSGTVTFNGDSTVHVTSHYNCPDCQFERQVVETEVVFDGTDRISLDASTSAELVFGEYVSTTLDTSNCQSFAINLEVDDLFIRPGGYTSSVDFVSASGDGEFLLTKSNGRCTLSGAGAIGGVGIFEMGKDMPNTPLELWCPNSRLHFADNLNDIQGALKVTARSVSSMYLVAESVQISATEGISIHSISVSQDSSINAKGVAAVGFSPLTDMKLEATTPAGGVLRVHDVNYDTKTELPDPEDWNANKIFYKLGKGNTLLAVTGASVLLHTVPATYSSLSGGAIAGIVIGSIAAACLIGVGVYFIWKYFSAKSVAKDEELRPIVKESNKSESTSTSTVKSSSSHEQPERSD